MGERREKERERKQVTVTSIQAKPEKKRTVHFSTLLLHSPLLSGCAVRIIRKKLEEREIEREEQEKKKRNNMLNVFMLEEENKQTKKKMNIYRLEEERRKEKKGRSKGVKIPHYYV